MSDLSARSGFAILSADDSPSAYATLPTGVSVPAGEVLFGRGPTGENRLLVPLKTDDIIVDGLGSVAITIQQRELVDNDDQALYLDVACARPDLEDVFAAFIDDLLDQLDAGSPPVEATAAVLDRWRDLLSQPKRPFGTRQLAGFLGELLVLLECLPLIPYPSLTVWTGPDGGLHDIVIGALHMEVKTTTSSKRRVARIHGLNQLEDVPNGTLILASIRLVPDPDGPVTLASLLQTAAGMAIPVSGVYERAAAAGLDPASLAERQEEGFRHVDSQYFEVDDSFPRLTPKALHGGVPAGVSDIEYTISLDGRDPVADNAVDLLRIMGSKG